MSPDTTKTSIEKAAPKPESALPKADAAGAQPPEEGALNQSDPVKRLTWILLAVVVLLFVWYIWADRYAPWTDQARVQAWIVPISPKVSGKVTKVEVVQDQIVKAGDLMVQIDKRDYELAVQKVEADLELAGQEIGASTEQVAVAEARLSEARWFSPFSCFRFRWSTFPFSDWCCSTPFIC